MPHSTRTVTASLALSLAAAAVPLRDATAQVTYVTSWGGPGTATGELQYPHGIACDSPGVVYVADWEADTLVCTVVSNWSDGSADTRVCPQP